MFRDTRNALLVAGLVLLLFADVLLLGRGFFKGDLFAYHFPMKKVVRDMTFADGLPQWNPRYHGGQPLAANPAYELWYPPQWLIYLPSFELGFQLHILLHLLLGAIGMYALLRSMGMREIAAAFGAVSFAAGAPYLSLLLRLPFLFSLTWTPLILLFARRLILAPNRRDFAWTALLVGMQAIIGEPVTLLQTAMLIAAYALYRGLPKRERGRLPRVLLIAGLAVVAGVIVAAVQIAPAFDHARDSVRSEGFSWQIVSNWSTPPVRLVELAYPRIHRALVDEEGNVAMRSLYAYRNDGFISDIYPGLLVVVLALSGLFAGVRGRGFVVALVTSFVLLALGEHTPLFRLLFDLELFASIRYPEKFLLGALIALILWAAIVLDRLLDGDVRVRKAAIWLTAVWLGFGLIIWMAGTRDAAPSTPDAIPVAWTPYWLQNVARAIAVLLLLRYVATRPRWSPAILAFVALDFSFVHHSFAARAPREFVEEPAIAKQLPANREQYRVFSEASWQDWAGAGEAIDYYRNAPVDERSRDAMMQFRPAAFGFNGALEDDLDQTALLSSTGFLRAAVGVWRVTQSWNTFFLDAANVEQVIVLENAQAVVRGVGSHPRYRFATRVLPMAYDTELTQAILANNVKDGDAFVRPPVTPAGTGRVLRVDEKPSRITIDAEAEESALLVASVTSHRYWSATLDGKPVAIVPVNIAFQGVVVPAGRHVIELRYRNPWILPSAIVSGLAIAGLLGLALRPS